MTVNRQRKRADAERNIAAILDAARDLFSRGAAPSMSEIASAAGVGRVTLYAHFPSREVLLEAVVDRALSETVTTLEELNIDDGPAHGALERTVRTSWPLLSRYGRLREVAVAVLGQDRLLEHHHRSADWLERLISRGQRDGSFRTDMPRRWLIAMFYSVLHTGADEVSAARLSPAEAPDVLAATVLSVLRKPG